MKKTDAEKNNISCPSVNLSELEFELGPTSKVLSPSQALSTTRGFDFKSQKCHTDLWCHNDCSDSLSFQLKERHHGYGCGLLPSSL